jgi:hypothetical protein
MTQPSAAATARHGAALAGNDRGREQKCMHTYTTGQDRIAPCACHDGGRGSSQQAVEGPGQTCSTEWIAHRRACGPAAEAPMHSDRREGRQEAVTPCRCAHRSLNEKCWHKRHTACAARPLKVSSLARAQILLACGGGREFPRVSGHRNVVATVALVVVAVAASALTASDCCLTSPCEGRGATAA